MCATLAITACGGQPRSEPDTEATRTRAAEQTEVAAVQGSTPTPVVAAPPTKSLESTATAVPLSEPILLADLMPSSDTVGEEFSTLLLLQGRLEQLPDTNSAPSETAATDGFIHGRGRSYEIDATKLTFGFGCQEYTDRDSAAEGFRDAVEVESRVHKIDPDEAQSVSVGDSSALFDVPELIDGTDYKGSFLLFSYGRFRCRAALVNNLIDTREPLTRIVQKTVASEAWPSLEQASAPADSSVGELTCSTGDDATVVSLLDEYYQEWVDALTLANQTPRMQLASQIEHLQEIRREVQRQAWPDCAELAQQWLIRAMDSSIDGLIAFLGQQPEEMVKEFADDAEDALETFQEQLNHIR